MAETSGFMTDLPQSAYLSLSMKRAISAAQQRSHRYVTLEHLLFALLDDPAAIEILEGVGADMPSIWGTINDTVNRNLTELYTPGRFELRASYKVERVLQTASDDANRLNCDEVDAAFVIASLSRESDSLGANILKRNGFSYSAAVTWLYANRGMTPRAHAARSKAKPAIAIVPDPAPDSNEQTADMRPQADMAGSAAPAMDEQPNQTFSAEDEPLELNQEITEEFDDIAPSKQASDAEAREELSRSILRRQAPQQSPPMEREEVDIQSSPDPQPDAAQPSEGNPPGELNRRLSEVVNEDRQVPQIPSVENRRKEPVLPPPSRLEEMRLGNAPARPRMQLPVPSAPPPPPPVQKNRRRRDGAQTDARSMPVPEPGRERQRGLVRRPSKRQETLIGRLIENIPRRMRAEKAERIEVRISREETQAFSRGFEGRGTPVHHNIYLTQTMSVALRAPDGGFIIEPLSPETQWIFDRPEPGHADIYGRWRWAVTPLHPGKMRLQLIVASRSIAPNGIVGDTALPDQIITISVRTNYWRSLGRSVRWIAAMILGGVVTELAVFVMRLLG